ncbi:TonB-dependent receptor [Xylella fastidiosa subsp. sandyi]|uniref:TonB-dependent receptor n=1 Tax=Xylella fastidiosa TaxID=2371 RepID=UPI00070832D3|nr:TonB-dependent receptor [Xylella fastidiosa]KQH74296.1 ligand-gated channel [Xylella fastidiosa]RWA43997.1 ligand-gated channel [Xylella fastidiosa subsp. sandyi]WNY18703.1 TonB-dependent receptor [Xylella fastidiosa]WNY20990.1 TonB-dependent receptor [Xylella fastidiosa]
MLVTHISILPRTVLFLAVSNLLLTPALAMADVGPPPTDSRHFKTTEVTRHLKDLDAVVVTAIPLRDSYSDLSRPVALLAGEMLDEVRASSLGETVAVLPGVQSSNFGPGVGRPIIRGLDGPRIAVLNNGLSSQDVSTVSQDHSPAVEPFLANQIEVLKGPSTLLYGSGAIGGVVNIVDGRIAEAPVGGFNGRAEMRLDGGDKHGNTNMFRIDAGNGSALSVHADGVYRNEKDYDTPKGRQVNSFIDTKSGSMGASFSGDFGFFGLSVARFHDSYGNPGEPGDPVAGDRGSWLRLHQDRYDLKAGLTDPWGEASALRFSLGHTQYDHIEFEGNEVGTTFGKRASEGRVEASFAFGGGWRTAFGVQGGGSTFQALGEESFVPKTNNKSIGVFGLAHNTFGLFQAEFGARGDQVKYDTDNGVTRNYHPGSFSFSGDLALSKQWRLTLNVDHAERAPVEEELFAKGPHIATLAYEVGRADMNKEKANQAELGLVFRNDWSDAKVSTYYSRYGNFIYLVDTGSTWFWDDGQRDLPVRQWSQANAIFHGIEGEATFHLAKNTSGSWDLRVFGDAVRGRLKDGGNLPRIVPARYGAELRWEDVGWRTSLGAKRYEKQNRVAVNETPTAGYTMVDAHLAYHIDVDNIAWEVFFDGNNLTNCDARVHTSFLKDDVMLAGRNYTVGLRMFF